jgi:type VI secretion system secreted protein VgrG
MARGSYAFELAAGAHGEGELSVTRFVGTEALSEPYLFEVDFFPVSGKALELEGLLAKEACLRVRRSDGAERTFHGIASAARLLGRKKGLPQYRVSISPRLSLLSLVKRSRTFLDRTVPEIAKEVLDGGKVRQSWKVEGSYPSREVTAQYRESDLAFVSRLLEREGIWFRFEQGTDGETLVVGDGPKGYAESKEAVPYLPEGALSEEEQLWELSRRSGTVPGRVVLRDYDFERPRLDLTAEAAEGEGEEVYECPGGYTDPAEGKRLARVRLEELRFGAETWRGRGRTLTLAAGQVFEVEGHPEASWNGKLLAVRVRHEGRREEGAGGVETRYASSFLGIAAKRPYRPRRRTAAPEIYGFQRATVVGPEGEEIHTDRHGRVKVALHWNSGSSEPPKSGWVRVLQAMAGPGFGALYLPRVGQEVILSYQGGDPQRPMVVGAVYHGAHPPAVELPKEKTQSTFRTVTSPYDGGYNELRLEDAAGSEEIFLRSQKDEAIEVLADKGQTVGGSETLAVGKDRSREIRGDQQLRVALDDGSTVGGNQTLAVMMNRETSVLGDHSETVGLAQTVNVTGEQTVHVAKATNVTVGAAAALNVGGVYLVNVGIDHNTLVGGARLEEIGGFKGELVGLHREERVLGDKSSTVKGEVVEQVDGSATRVTDGDEEQVAERIEITVVELAQLAAKRVSIEADTFTVVVGGNVMLKMEKSGRAQIFGKTIVVDGEVIELSGGQIQKIEAGPPPTAGFAAVEFTLTDKTGNPVAGELYRVELPGGKVVSGMTDSKGHAKVLGPKEGSAKVTFPLIHETAVQQQ